MGVLISNLGTPKSFKSGDISRYLSEFLTDPYVIQAPKWVRGFLVKAVIIPFRKKKTAARYKKIWSAEGSPLMVQTKKFSEVLQRELGENYQVSFAMRYGEPGFLRAKNELKTCQKVIFFPQYPQYARSTVETSLQHFYKYFSKKNSQVIPPYYRDSEFIEAYVRFLEPYLKSLDFDYLLMSFHGLPVSHIKKTDPTEEHCLNRPDCCLKVSGSVLKTCYRAQCFYLARALARALNLSEKKYGISFQSRLGPNKWIGPGTETTYSHLIHRGVRRLVVFCPGFSVDGLETLEEIAIEGKRRFIQQGGESFQWIPCLNDSPHWVRACAKMIKKMEFRG